MSKKSKLTILISTLLEKLKSQHKWIIVNSKKFKNIRNATPTTYSHLTQNSINL
jgi:hypothetical protein